uniref:cystathionine gamma-lyase n=1 Tax=Megaselia scalaris TaxID=36166 RepID=T1GQM2_MEGSC
MSFRSQPNGFASKAIHVGQEPEQWNSMCVAPAIITSTNYKQDAPGVHRGYYYSRGNNPTRNVLQKCLASLDNGKHGLVRTDVYGGINRLIRQVASRLGILYDFVDLTNFEALESAIRPSTKLFWIETPTNPLLKVIDIESVSKIAHTKANIVLVVDNTFLTPYFQRPLELGADIVFYSLTKYMNGHNDVIMGAAITNSDEIFEKLRFLQNATGIIASPFDCYQVNRSLKTLALRMEQHQKSAMKIAKYLEKHPFVEKVLYPGLPSHPQHGLALKQTYGCSGVFSFYIKGNLESSKRFFESLKFFTLAESLGGYESLAELPAIMTHASIPAEDRIKLGITDNLIRLSVGLEDVDDLIEDLEKALEASQG